MDPRRGPSTPAMLVLLSILVAGCTGDPLPAANVAPETAPTGGASCQGDTCAGAVLVVDDEPVDDLPRGILAISPKNGTQEPGAFIRISAVHHGETPGASSVHFGPVSVPDPTRGSYPFTLVDHFGVRLTDLSIPMPPSGPLFLRVHLEDGTGSWWSGERRYDPAGRGHLAKVTTPSRMDAGVPFSVQVEATTSAPQVAIALVFSRDLAGTLVEGEQLTRAPERFDEILGVLRGGEGKVSGHVTIPMAGDWWVRPVLYRVDVHPHTGRDVILERIAAGDATLLQVAKPIAPNLVVFATDYACDTCPMTQLDAFIALNGPFPEGARVDLLGFRASTREGAPRVSDATHLGDARSATSERVTIEFTRTDAVNYIRARVAVGEQEIWSDEHRLSSLG